MVPWAHPSPHPKRNVFAGLTAENPCISQLCAPYPPQNCPFAWRDLDPHLIHGSMDPPESSTQTASRSVQPFLQGSLVWQTDWLTDHATRSVTIGRICVRSTAMWPNNYYYAAQKPILNLPSHGVGKLSWPRHIVREGSACPMRCISEKWWQTLDL